MKIVTLPKGQGKSTDLAKYMATPGNEDTVYVAPTRSMAEGVGKALLEQFGVSPTEASRRVTTAHSAKSAFQGQNVRLVVDEVDGVLQVLLGSPVALGALTPDTMKSRERGGEAF